MNILVVFRNIPPDIGGSSTVISNLFKFADSQIVITGRASRAKCSENAVNYQKIEIPLSDGKHSLFIKVKCFIQSALICLKLIKEKDIKKILGVYRDESSLVLSFCSSLLSQKPLYIYLTDLYAENYNSYMKKIIQRIIFKRAKKLFCLNEAMRLHYVSLGYDKVFVIPSTVASVAQNSFKEFNGGVFKIAFSGTITYDRLDLLQNLVGSFRGKTDFHIYFFTPQDHDFLISNNLTAENMTFEFINSQSALIEKLKQCHLLYLPLTFKAPNNIRGKQQLKTCLGTKSFEYMQTGVPIIVHCPREYYTYKFFEKNKSAILLDSEEEGDLELRIIEVKNNYSDYSVVVSNAQDQLTEHLSKPNYFKLLNLMK